MPNPNQNYINGVGNANFFGIDNSVQGTGLGVAPTGYGQYDSLFAANPYRNLTYNQSGWQKFLSSLGFRTSYDAWLENAQVNSNEYDAGIFSMMQQNEYNSPDAQAARMRQAGVNPDLLGLGDNIGAASPIEDPNGMNPTTAEDAQQFAKIGTTVATSVMGLIPNIMSFATQVSELRGIRAANDLKEMEFNSGAIDYADKFFTEGITPAMYKEAFEKQDFDNILDAAVKSSDSLARQLFTSKQAVKRFNLTYQTHAKSLVAEMSKYKTYDEYEKYRKSLIEQRANPFFSDDNETMHELMSSVLGPLNRWQKRIYEINERIANLRRPDLEQGLANKQMENQAAYENAIDPVLQAEAENTANERSSQENEIINATNDMFSEIMKALDGKDAWYTDIAKALVGIARGYIMSQVHVSFGRQQHINPINGNIEDLSSVNVFQ